MAFMPDPKDDTGVAAHVAFAGRLARWVERAGVTDGEAIGDLAVGFADILDAAARARPELDALLELDPRDPAGADQALTHLGYLRALFVGEIKSHADDLANRWTQLEDRLAATTAPENDPDEQNESAV
jgi:hypothetical protein